MYILYNIIIYIIKIFKKRLYSTRKQQENELCMGVTCTKTNYKQLKYTSTVE